MIAPVIFELNGLCHQDFPFFERADGVALAFLGFCGLCMGAGGAFAMIRRALSKTASESSDPKLRAAVLNRSS